jgi:hypothetical protein
LCIWLLVFFIALLQIPDSIQDAIAPGRQQDKIITHCRRELMHKVWAILLDDEFVAAYEHGFIAECQDGISQRFYPRIFTYSADYPEKLALLIIFLGRGANILQNKDRSNS